jgi:hypothetical protein
VSCPAVGSSREYVYDDTYADCYFRSDTALAFDSSFDVTDVFACLDGFLCYGLECSRPFNDFQIDAQVSNFYDTCVEYPAIITPFPTKAPPPSSYKFSASFEASWGTFYDPVELYFLCSGSPMRIVVITCGNGAEITYISTDSKETNCAENGSNEILCFTNQDSFVNQFVSVFYVSSFCSLIALQ